MLAENTAECQKGLRENDEMQIMETYPKVFLPNNNSIFLDSMVWIEAARDSVFRSALRNWLKGPPKNHPIIHSLLEFEVLACDDQCEFDQLWELLLEHPRSNYSPIELMRSEIGWKVCAKDENEFLNGVYFQYTKEQLQEHKANIRHSAIEIKAEKHRQAGSENFIKIAAQRGGGILASTNLLGLIAQAEQSNLDAIIEDGDHFSKNLETFVHKSIKGKPGILQETCRVIDEYNSQTARSVIENEIRQARMICKYGFKISKETTYGEFSDMMFLLEMARDAYNNGHMENMSSTEVVSRIVKSEPGSYPGFNALRTISKFARASKAKAKQGDQADFMNSTYLPYVDMYVTDANIAEIIRQCLPQYGAKIKSFAEFRKMALEWDY